MSPMRLFACGLLFLAASLPAQDPVRYHGLELKLPKGWTSKVAEDVTLLLTPGWKQDEQTGEAYGLLFDGEIKELGSEDLGETIDGAAEAIFAAAKRKGTVADETLGALPAKTFRYGGQNDAGQEVELRIHVFAVKDGCAALFMLGFPNKLKARSEEMKALLGSLQLEGQKPKKRAFGSKSGDPEPGREAPPTEISEARPAAQNPLGRRPQEPGEQPVTGGQNPLGRKPEGGAEGAQRIAGGTESDWNGVKLDVPKGWKTQAGDEGVLMLMPPGFGESGVLDELYVLCGDGSLKSLDAPDAASRIKQALDEVQPGLTADGTGKAARFGALPGKTFAYNGAAANGEKVRAVVYAFPSTGGVRALLALGYPAKLKAREGELQTVLGSMRAGAPALGGVVQELVGRWIYFTNVSLNNGGRASQTVLTLKGDGSYLYSAETSSTNPLGGTVNNSRDEGRWSLQGESLVFRSAQGGEASYRLEKKNHPKNNDPMLVLDGKAFVTETQRAPW